MARPWLHTKAFGVIKAPAQPEMAQELWAEMAGAEASGARPRLSHFLWLSPLCGGLRRRWATHAAAPRTLALCCLPRTTQAARGRAGAVAI